MEQSRDVGRGIGAIGIIVGINLVIGFVGYFIAFLFAYGFSDQIDPAQHVFFLILIGILVAIGAAVSALVIKSAMRLTWSGAASLAVTVGLAINLLVLGIGSIISAQHIADGSVSEDFSTSTDVIVAASLLGAALVSAYFAWRAAPPPSMTSRTFTALVEGRKVKAYVVMPFDPDEVWGARPSHLLHGTINGCGFRGGFEKIDGEWRCSLGPTWRRDNGVELGDELTLVLEPEGPQRAAVDDDIAEALNASPKAAAAFDGLAQFYRKAFLKWIDGTKKRPDERVRRIAHMVSQLEAGAKTR